MIKSCKILTKFINHEQQKCYNLLGDSYAGPRQVRKRGPIDPTRPAQ